MFRLFHWGPLMALGIIKIVTFTTLSTVPQWCIMTSSWLAMVNYVFYYFLLTSVMYNFLMAIFVGPGHVPPNWKPKTEADQKFLQYCLQCDAFKAPRSHHCSKCKKCVLKMDHHCPWINNCCGFRNQKYFFYFLLSTTIGGVHSLVLNVLTLYRAFNYIPNVNNRFIHITFYKLFFIILTIGFSFGVIVAIGSLLFLQGRILVSNKTSIEDWIVKKANMREREEPFIYPYNLGVWKNIKQLLWDPQGDGIEWEVRNDCHQYTLTEEQLYLKKLKFAHAALYRIISPYNGRFFPLFSQGCRVCLSFPITDDPRLVLNPGDEVLVTHSQKRWLYGLIQNDPTNPRYKKKGWFPARCAALLVSPDTDILNSRADDKKDA